MNGAPPPALTPGDLLRLPLGFADPVADAQISFRAALQALSMPGTPVSCSLAAPAVSSLMPATVALLLALTDHESPVWWATPEAAPWLQFHTGAPAASAPRHASFAVCPVGCAWPGLDAFNPGHDVSPEESTTLLVELPSWQGGRATQWFGPGLREPRTLHLQGLPPDFWAQWALNHASFPSGVDVIFVCGDQMLGLPRTTAVANAAQGAP